MSTDTTKRVYGIDLGTTYSAIAYVDEFGQANAIRNSEGDTTTPSVVYFAPDGKFAVGKEAKKAAADSNENAKRTVAFVKREMSNASWSREYDGENYSPADISSIILQRIAENTKEHGGHDVKDVVITCPAYFGETERTNTRQAGRMARLNVLEILDEPVAAAINYGLEAEKKGQNIKGQNIIVYDLGGGTFDATVVSIGNAPDKTEIRVVCTEGDHQLGGFDWDKRIVEYAKQLFRDENGVDLMDSEDAFEAEGQLKLDAEENKKSLSLRGSVKFKISADNGSVKFELTRKQFDTMTADLLEATFTLTDALIKDARKRGIEKYDAFLLVGGSTLMPQVAEKVKEWFSAHPELGITEPVYFDVHEAVAKGAAKEAEIKYIQGLICDVQGLDSEQGGGTAEPPSQEIAQQVALLTGKSVDEVIRIAKTKTVKVATKSYGIRAVINGELCVSNLIKKQTPVPFEFTGSYLTLGDWDTMPLPIHSNDVDADEAPLGDSPLLVEKEFPLPSLLPEGTPVDVTFKLNDEGKLTIIGKEKLNGREFQFDFVPPGALTEEEVEEKVKENALRSVS